MNYICTHKDFKEFTNTGEYTILTTAQLQNNYSFPVISVKNDLEPLKYSYCEGYMIKNIYLNLNHYNNTQWIGINHYRRYFEDPKKETTLPVPYNTNLQQQYAACHNINDLLQIEKIIDTYYPEYSTDYSKINLLFPCNMFIMKRPDFVKYYNFVFGVLKIFSRQNNLNTDEDVKRYVEKNKYCYRHFDIDYQSRLHGFLMERLSTIFFIKEYGEKNVVLKPIKTV